MFPGVIVTTYQAGIGPSQTNLHIYQTPPLHADVPKMALCGAVNVVRNYKAEVSISNAKLCKRCFFLLQKVIGSDAGITAEMIGVSSIED
jgi:hypothetical protein